MEVDTEAFTTVPGMILFLKEGARSLVFNSDSRTVL